jgi:hypothetical protein
MITKGRPVHVKNYKEFRQLKNKRKFGDPKEEKLLKKIEKLEEKQKGLENMIFNTRAQLFDFFAQIDWFKDHRIIGQGEKRLQLDPAGKYSRLKIGNHHYKIKKRKQL